MRNESSARKYSSIAQSVEHSAVNRVVVGSSPTWGAKVWPLGQVVKTPPFHGDNMGSNPVGVTTLFFGPLAQLVEQLTLNQWVPGSNP